MSEISIKVPEDMGGGDKGVVVLTWLYADGEAVEAGEVLVELTVEKAQYELEAPASGTLRIQVPEEEVVAPGGVLGVIETG